MTSFTACIDDHILSSVPIGSAGGGGDVNTQHEEVIVIFHQYALLLLERGKSRVSLRRGGMDVILLPICGHWASWCTKCMLVRCRLRRLVHT